MYMIFVTIIWNKLQRVLWQTKEKRNHTQQSFAEKWGSFFFFEQEDTPRDLHRQSDAGTRAVLYCASQQNSRTTSLPRKRICVLCLCGSDYWDWLCTTTVIEVLPQPFDLQLFLTWLIQWDDWLISRVKWLLSQQFLKCQNISEKAQHINVHFSMCVLENFY